MSTPLARARSTAIPSSPRTCLAAAGFAVLLVTACSVIDVTPAERSDDTVAKRRHVQAVMSSRFCADCHPATYAEHEQNTHGRAFTDEEVRLATGRFDHGDCIRCHTPRPIFETGVGNNPQRRYHDLEEGNTCMTCHWRPDYDYGSFRGGAQCKEAFHPDVGTVEACASCHRNHGTPYQWELAPTGKAAGKRCVSCHMATVTRPVAVGTEPRLVHSHVFPASRSESQLRRAYAWDATITGDEVVVTIANDGAGHNFPTELKQRSVESVVVVHDREGLEVSRSRMVFRDPYKRPYGLELPVNTQIPAGQEREHRVPLKVAAGTVTCELHYKLYYPIEDFHPDLSRLLESRTLAFDGVTPSMKPVETAPEVAVRVPEGISVEAASPADLVDYARPPIGTVEVDIPSDSGPASIAKLIELFQFPVPEATGHARARLVAIGMPAVPALIEALGSWDNKTFHQAETVLKQIGDPASATVVEALDSKSLYVRIHAREVAADMGWTENGATAKALARWVDADHALDRASAIEALGVLGATEHAAAIRGRIDDPDPDVVRAAALAAAALGDREAVPALEKALADAPWAETCCDIAQALARLGSTAAIQALLKGLDHPDDLILEDFFEAFFAVTGRHMSFDPLAPRPDRLAALSRLQAAWARTGDAGWLRTPREVDPRVNAKAWKLVEQVGGGTGQVPAGDDAKILPQLVALGEDAVPSLVLGLKFPAGFADKRVRLIEALGRIGSKDAAPALAATLRDPVVAVAAWACWALSTCGDAECLPALERWRDRVNSLAAAGRLPPEAGTREVLLAQGAATRLALGDERARGELADLLLAHEASARRTAIDALARQNGGDPRGYDPDAAPETRAAAARAWRQ
jgi:HEAT repeat protein